MTEDEIAAIKARHLRDDWCRDTLLLSPQMHDDRGALLAEVERLTADAAALREALKLQHQEDKAICTPAFNAVRAALEGER